jgi:hypothetical protein
MVLIKSDTWLIDTPNAAGSMSFSMRRTPGCLKSSRQRGRSFNFSKKGIWKASWRAPPAKTDHARTSTGSSKRSAKPSAPVMKAMLRNAGVMAGTEKRFQVLRMPAEKATSEMKTM